MDIYTTSFCLPRNPLTHELSPSTSFDYGARDTAGRPGAAVSAGANGNGATQQLQSPQQGGQQAHPAAGGNHSTANSVDSSPSFANSSPTQTRTSSSSLSTDASSANGPNGGSGTNTSVGSRSSTDLNDAMHRLCVDAMAAHQCLVSFSTLDPANFAPPQPSTTSSQPQQQSPQQQQGPGAPVAPPGRMINFHLSGGYQQVMSARGSLLRDNPFKVAFSFCCRQTSTLRS